MTSSDHDHPGTALRPRTKPNPSPGLPVTVLSRQKRQRVWRYRKSLHRPDRHHPKHRHFGKITSYEYGRSRKPIYNILTSSVRDPNKRRPRLSTTPGARTSPAPNTSSSVTLSSYDKPVTRSARPMPRANTTTYPRSDCSWSSVQSKPIASRHPSPCRRLALHPASERLQTVDTRTDRSRNTPVNQAFTTTLMYDLPSRQNVTQNLPRFTVAQQLRLGPCSYVYDGTSLSLSAHLPVSATGPSQPVPTNADNNILAHTCPAFSLTELSPGPTPGP